MARTSSEEIERMKAEISLERLALRVGVELRKQGKDLVGRCPFHADREPSLVITPEKNLWHCLGECQAGGSVIDWVMRAEGVSYRHALELLREDLPSLAAELPKARSGAGVVKKSTVTKLAGEIETGESDEALLSRVVDFYAQTLKQSAEALEYLEKRGLRSAELIERFRLGYANRTLAYRLPAKNRSAGAALRGQLQHVGVLRESGHEHLNGSLVVPIFDEEGRVVEMYGRKIGERLRPGTALHLYLPGPHRGVWNSEGVRDAGGEVILCESLIDAMTFWVAGYRNVTTTYGVEGFGEDHREAFRRYGVRKVWIAYDRDEAGDKAAEKLAPELRAAGIECFRVTFPKGMDANEYALKVKPAEKAFGTVLGSAEWMGGAGGAPRAAKPGRVEAHAVARLPASPPRAELEQAARKGNEAVVVEREDEPESAPLRAEVAEQKAPTEAETPALQSEGIPSLAAPATPSAAELRVSSQSDEAAIDFGDRRWRVRGMQKNLTAGILRVNLFCARERSGFHVDTLDLYSARHRAAFLKQAVDELGVEERLLKADLGHLLLKLEGLQEQMMSQANEATVKVVELTEEEITAALELLQSPHLLERIVTDIERCGLVGERTNKLVAYLAATSRKLEQPLAIVVQSSSAAGKSSLMEAVLRLMPEEERVQYSAMTGQSLFYMGETNLSHKILAIAEEEGAERASYALKLLQSEGELTIASTGKDPATGRLITQEYRVEGPVMIFLTTTALEVDEELLNRCIVLTVDEGREQTRAIHERQRHAQTLEGLLQHDDRGHVMALHQNAQRLLKPLLVANPYAKELTFLDHQTRTRRDHMKYLTLIRAIALLHQYQREVKTVEHRGSTVRYIEATREDIAVADRLCREVLSSTLDQLPPKTRELLRRLGEFVAEQAAALGIDRADVRFTRREVRERTQLGNTQLKLHLGRLLEMEYLELHRERHGQRFAYSLTVGLEGVSEAILAADEASEPTMGTTEHVVEHEYDAKPVGGGRGAVGGEPRPVIVSDYGEMRGAVGGEHKTTTRPKLNGSSYAPLVKAAHPLAAVAAPAAAPAE